jgi:hypothetical protein
MKKSFLIIILFIAIGASCEAQVGYLGKRLAVKVNALSGRENLFSGFEVEYTVRRNLTFCFGYSSNNYESTFNFSDFENINTWIQFPYSYYSYYDNDNMFFDNLASSSTNASVPAPGFKTKVSDGKMVTNRRVFDFSFRLYSNSYLSAPSGFYSQYGLGFGSQSYNGGIYYPNDIIQINDGNNYKTNFYSESFERYKKKDPLFNMYIGFGYQHIFSKWVTLDFNLNAGAGFIANKDVKNGNSAGDNNFGIILNEQKELLRIGNLVGSGKSSPSSLGISGPVSAFYLSGFVKLGILIF